MTGSNGGPVVVVVTYKYGSKREKKKNSIYFVFNIRKYFGWQMSVVCSFVFTSGYHGFEFLQIKYETEKTKAHQICAADVKH